VLMVKLRCLKVFPIVNDGMSSIFFFTHGDGAAMLYLQQNCCQAGISYGLGYSKLVSARKILKVSCTSPHH